MLKSQLVRCKTETRDSGSLTSIPLFSLVRGIHCHKKDLENSIGDSVLLWEGRNREKFTAKMYGRASPDSHRTKAGNGNVIKMCGEEVMGKKLLFYKFF